MGLALDTAQTFDYVLTMDKDKPESERPTLVFRFVSYRDFNRMLTVFGEAEASKDGGDGLGYFDKIQAALRIALVGWRNFPVAYDPNELDNVCTANDLRELRDNILAQMYASETEKRSRLQPPSATEQSVKETAA